MHGLSLSHTLLSTVYGHLLPGWQKEAADAFAKAPYSLVVGVKFATVHVFSRMRRVGLGLECGEFM